MTPNPFESGDYQTTLRDLKAKLDEMALAYEQAIADQVKKLGAATPGTTEEKDALAAIEKERVNHEKQKKATERAIELIEEAAKRAEEKAAREKAVDDLIAKEQERNRKEKERLEANQKKLDDQAAREVERQQKELDRKAEKQKKLDEQTQRELDRAYAAAQKDAERKQKQQTRFDKETQRELDRGYQQSLSDKQAAEAKAKEDARNRMQLLMDPFGKLAADIPGLSLAIKAVNTGLNALATYLQITTRLYRANTEAQAATLQRDTLGAEIAQRKGQSEANQAAVSWIPFVGSTLAKVIGAAADAQIAKLERQRTMEQGIVKKIDELSQVSNLGVQQVQLQMQQMKLQQQEAQALGPQLQEFTQVKMELESLRAQQSMADNLKSIKESIGTMRQEIDFRTLTDGLDNMSASVVAMLQRMGYSSDEIRDNLAQMFPHIESTAVHTAKLAGQAVGNAMHLSPVTDLLNDLRKNAPASDNSAPPFVQTPQIGGGLPPFMGNV